MPTIRIAVRKPRIGGGAAPAFRALVGMAQEMDRLFDSDWSWWSPPRMQRENWIAWSLAVRVLRRSGEIRSTAPGGRHRQAPPITALKARRQGYTYLSTALTVMQHQHATHIDWQVVGIYGMG